MSITARPNELLRGFEMDRLRSENEQLRAALEHYAKPRVYGIGEHSIFVDDCGVAKAVLRQIDEQKP